MYSAYTTAVTLSIKFIWLQKRYKIKSRKKCLCMYNSEKQNKNSLFKEESFPFLIKNIPLRV